MGWLDVVVGVGAVVRLTGVGGAGVRAVRVVHVGTAGGREVADRGRHTVVRQ